LLLMDETKFSRVGSTTETFGTGFSPAPTPPHVRQHARQQQVEQYPVSQLRSIYFLFCALPHPARRNENAPWRSVSLAYPWLSCSCQEGAMAFHSSKSSAAFSRFLADVVYSAPGSLSETILLTGKPHF